MAIKVYGPTSVTIILRSADRTVMTMHPLATILAHHETRETFARAASFDLRNSVRLDSRRGHSPEHRHAGGHDQDLLRILSQRSSPSRSPVSGPARCQSAIGGPRDVGESCSAAARAHDAPNGRPEARQQNVRIDDCF